MTETPTKLMRKSAFGLLNAIVFPLAIDRLYFCSHQRPLSRRTSPRFIHCAVVCIALSYLFSISF